MRSGLKTTLANRKTSEHAARLLAWVDENLQLLQHDGPGLRDEIESILVELGRAGQTIEELPALGVLGSSLQSELVATLIGKAATSSDPVAADSGDAAQALGPAVLSRDGAGPLCALIRHSTSPSSASTRDYPIPCSLLSELDVTKILARAYLSFVPLSRCEPVSANEVGQLFSDVSSRLSAEALPGFSRRDVVDLREDLHAHHPQSAFLGGLAAAGYWDVLAETISHLEAADRFRLLALLWKNEPEFTSLFVRLVGCLERVGPGADICCAPEAVFTTLSRHGPFLRHRRAVFDLAALLDMGSMDDEPVGVGTHYGRTEQLSRAELAALIAEVPVTWPSSRHSPLGDMGILQFPSAHIGAELPLSLYVGPRKGRLSSAMVARFFAHVKATYLFERSCKRGEITALAVCVDPMADDGGALAPSIAEWIGTAQGSDPGQREKTRTGLFIVEMSRTPAEGERTLVRSPPGEWHERMGEIITTGLGAGQDWPREWTPGRPFDNVFKFQNVPPKFPGENQVVPASPRQLRKAGADRGNVLALPALFRRSEATRTGRNVEPANQGAAADFVRSTLRPVTSASSKKRQFDARLSELRRRLKGRLRRYHVSNDPGRTAEWRRQVANVAQSRLHRCAETGRLGHLLEALMVRESELIALFHRSGSPASVIAPELPGPAAGKGEYHEEGGMALALRRGEDAARCERNATRALVYWFRHMRQRSRSATLCRFLGVPQPLLQHIVDELIVGAERSGLATRLSDALLAARSAEHQVADDALQVAAYARWIIGGFLETLGAPPRLRDSAACDDSGGEAEGIGTLSTIPKHPLPSAAVGRRVSDVWLGAFSALVEANITADSSLAGTIEQDRELGEILDCLVSAPAEVEL